MVVILRNEVLGECGDKVIYKTYDCEKDRYGMYKETPDESETQLYGLNMAIDCSSKYLVATYSHIFPFSQDSQAAAITDAGEYIWLDLDFKESKMTEEDRLIWASCYITNSICNCSQNFDKMFNCNMCQAGTIFNKLNFRKIEDNNGNITYEYETELNTYLLELTPTVDKPITYVDYIWSDDEVEAGLRGEIDTYEEQVFELRSHLNICVHERIYNGYILSYYSVTIKITDTSIAIVANNDVLILGFHEFTALNKN